MEAITTVDFETEKIEKRPVYPPRPVGVAIQTPDRKSEYLAFGHPSGNNSTYADARKALHRACQGRVLFHNAAFDQDVLACSFGLAPRRIEDTLYLGFLDNPHGELSLKPMAAHYLNMPPDEQEALRDWIIDNVPGARRKKMKWGEFISEAPGDIVAPYAIGDVERTRAVFDHLHPKIVKRGMLGAYEREIELTPLTMEMEHSGVRIDVPGLKNALRAFEELDAKLLKRIHRKLRVGKDFNLNSPKQLSEALLNAGKLDAIIKTKSGGVSTKVDSLNKTCNDKELLQLLSVHSVLEKYTSSFMRPWILQAEQTNGRLLPTFNQCRGRDEGGGGTRSGRYSSSDPNLQTVAANIEDSKNREVLLLMQDWLRKECNLDFVGLRDFFLPDEGSVMVCIDYNQQELRILAHFEQDVLMRAYLENPLLDIHTFCQQLVKKVTGIEFPRKYIKVTVFGIVYGMGVDKLAQQLGVETSVAKQVRDGIYAAIPGIRALQKELRRLADRDKPLRTWGGREYFCEEPRFDEKRRKWMSFEYKMLNYLIQPSAADCTKEGMRNVRIAVPDSRIAIQVHDELVCMAPSKAHGKRIAEAMCDIKMNVPMVAEPKYSTTTWARAA